MNIKYCSLLVTISLLSLGAIGDRANASDFNPKASNYIAGCASKPNPCAGADKPNPCASTDKPNPCASANKPNPCAAKPRRNSWGLHHSY